MEKGACSPHSICFCSSFDFYHWIRHWKVHILGNSRENSLVDARMAPKIRHYYTVILININTDAYRVDYVNSSNFYISTSSFNTNIISAIQQRLIISSLKLCVNKIRGNQDKDNRTKINIKRELFQTQR